MGCKQWGKGWKVHVESRSEAGRRALLLVSISNAAFNFSLLSFSLSFPLRVLVAFSFRISHFLLLPFAFLPFLSALCCCAFVSSTSAPGFCRFSLREFVSTVGFCCLLWNASSYVERETVYTVRCAKVWISLKKKHGRT